jgi:hypothetical protein
VQITEKIVGERRIMALRDLGTRATNAKTAEEGCAIAAEALAKHAKDVPFSLIYLVDPDRQRGALGWVRWCRRGRRSQPTGHRPQ